jgi:hypothetical protein
MVLQQGYQQKEAAKTQNQKKAAKKTIKQFHVPVDHEIFFFSI